jgi:hypothetical protein
MLTYFLNIMMMLFVIAACSYSLINEKRRNKEMDHVIDRLKKQWKIK